MSPRARTGGPDAPAPRSPAASLATHRRLRRLARAPQPRRGRRARPPRARRARPARDARRAVLARRRRDRTPARPGQVPGLAPAQGPGGRRLRRPGAGLAALPHRHAAVRHRRHRRRPPPARRGRRGGRPRGRAARRARRRRHPQRRQRDDHQHGRAGQRAAGLGLGRDAPPRCRAPPQVVRCCSTWTPPPSPASSCPRASGRPVRRPRARSTSSSRGWPTNAAAAGRPPATRPTAACSPSARPVRDSGGTVVAALGVSGPESRVDPVFDEVRAAVLRAATDLSRALGAGPRAVPAPGPDHPHRAPTACLPCPPPLLPREERRELSGLSDVEPRNRSCS